MSKRLTDYKVESNEMGKVLIDKIKSISTFNLERYYNKTSGKYEYGYNPFDIFFTTDTEVSVEQEIMEMHESHPLGINLEITEFDRTGEVILGIWIIQKAVINKLSFGGFESGDYSAKIISVNFLPTGIKFVSGKEIKKDKKDEVQE